MRDGPTDEPAEEHERDGADHEQDEDDGDRARPQRLRLVNGRPLTTLERGVESVLRAHRSAVLVGGRVVGSAGALLGVHGGRLLGIGDDVIGYPRPRRRRCVGEEHLESLRHVSDLGTSHVVEETELRRRVALHLARGAHRGKLPARRVHAGDTPDRGDDHGRGQRDRSEREEQQPTGDRERPQPRLVGNDGGTTGGVAGHSATVGRRADRFGQPTTFGTRAGDEAGAGLGFVLGLRLRFRFGFGFRVGLGFGLRLGHLGFGFGFGFGFRFRFGFGFGFGPRFDGLSLGLGLDGFGRRRADGRQARRGRETGSLDSGSGNGTISIRICCSAMLAPSRNARSLTGTVPVRRTSRLPPTPNLEQGSMEG